MARVKDSKVRARIVKLQKGDPLAVIGSLKPTKWTDKTTGEPKHGLNVTANNALSPYDIKKRKPVTDAGISNATNTNSRFPVRETLVARRMPE